MKILSILGLLAMNSAIAAPTVTCENRVPSESGTNVATRFILRPATSDEGYIAELFRTGADTGETTVESTGESYPLHCTFSELQPLFTCRGGSRMSPTNASLSRVTIFPTETTGSADSLAPPPFLRLRLEKGGNPFKTTNDGFEVTTQFELSECQITQSPTVN
ncbi:MAG: hypothetical protein H7301_15000 [Cryobacterium sp.]|nr:hypothetical protein [Oligoflexia bacterium]